MLHALRQQHHGRHVPLSTLHVQPCDCPRMTRGQVGSLRLTCTTLAFATSRRFIPAHSNLGPTSRFFQVVWGNYKNEGQIRKDLQLDFLRKFESIRQRTEYSFFYENVELPTNC